MSAFGNPGTSKRFFDESKERFLAKGRRLLEAAGQGNLNEIKDLINDIDKDDDEDGISHDEPGQIIRQHHKLEFLMFESSPRKTCALSEAAYSGKVEVVKFLLEFGVDPNTRGDYGKTPLYRAAYSGHLDVVKLLLEGGADPRIAANDGTIPENDADTEQIGKFLHNWNLSRTKELLSKLEKEKLARVKDKRRGTEIELSMMEKEAEDAQLEHRRLTATYESFLVKLNAKEAELKKARGKVPEKFHEEKRDVEGEAEYVRLRAENTKERWKNLRKKIRHKYINELGQEEKADLTTTIENLQKVIADKDKKIKHSKKWPLIIDTSGKSSRNLSLSDSSKQKSNFLSDLDATYLNTQNPAHMLAEYIRIALLNTIKYGKLFIVDLLDSPYWEQTVEKFDAVKPGLMASIINKSILKKKTFMQLVKDYDGNTFAESEFKPARVEEFQFLLLTTNPLLPTSFLFQEMFIVRVLPK